MVQSHTYPINVANQKQIIVEKVVLDYSTRHGRHRPPHTTVKPYQTTCEVKYIESLSTKQKI